jgi:hypothetical protein
MVAYDHLTRYKNKKHEQLDFLVGLDSKGVPIRRKIKPLRIKMEHFNQSLHLFERFRVATMFKDWSSMSFDIYLFVSLLASILDVYCFKKRNTSKNWEIRKQIRRLIRMMVNFQTFNENEEQVKSWAKKRKQGTVRYPCEFFEHGKKVKIKLLIQLAYERTKEGLYKKAFIGLSHAMIYFMQTFHDVSDFGIDVRRRSIDVCEKTLKRIVELL